MFLIQSYISVLSTPQNTTNIKEQDLICFDLRDITFIDGNRHMHMYRHQYEPI